MTLVGLDPPDELTVLAENTRLGPWLQGRHTDKSDEPKTTAIGIFMAAAICIGPLSLPTKAVASAIRAISSAKVRPAMT
jgi:hypothetical protein